MLIDRMSGWLTKLLMYQYPRAQAPLCDFERIRHELKPCDVLLIEGRSRVSQVIKQITQSPWSHAVLYLGRLHDIADARMRETLSEAIDCDPDEQLIIESELGYGTVVRPLSSYQGEHMRLCRPNGLSYADSQQVIHYAVSRLGMDYDVRQILDLARFFLPYSVLPRRWRSSLFQYSPGEATRTVCSSMIAEAFSFIRFPILPLVKISNKHGVQLFQRNPKLCTPKDFDMSPYFLIIKYPFLDYSLHADYKLLPWHGDTSLEGNEAELYVSPGKLAEIKQMRHDAVSNVSTVTDLDEVRNSQQKRE